MAISKIKVQCEKCKRKFRKSKVRKSKHSGKMLCYYCRRSEVTNPFYIPQKKYDNKGKLIGNYTMTDTEKILLRRKLMNNGMSFRQASYEIRKKVNCLKDMKRINQAKAILIIKEEKIKRSKKLLLGG